jgi:hypothetical protein
MIHDDAWVPVIGTHLPLVGDSLQLLPPESKTPLERVTVSIPLAQPFASIPGSHPPGKPAKPTTTNPT